MRRLQPIALSLALVLAGCADDAPPEVQQPAAEAAPAAPVAPLPELGALGHTRGAADAPVTVVEFSDFGCPYCARFALETYPELHREFVETGAVSWRYVPFVLGSFPNGDRAARTSECAGEQDRFWAMHDLLFERQREWKRADDAGAYFAGLAAELGLDPTAFAECYASARTEPRTEDANRMAAELGVRATPTFFINGRRIEGALPPDQFRMLLQWAGAP